MLISATFVTTIFPKFKISCKKWGCQGLINNPVQEFDKVSEFIENNIFQICSSQKLLFMER